MKTHFMQPEMILQLIRNISPHAEAYVNSALKNNMIQILYSIQSKQNEGVFLVAHSDDCIIFYASFLKENYDEEILEIIRTKTKSLISKAGSKEICFNVYGRNLKIIQLVKEMGFHTDMEGFHLQYVGSDLSKLNKSELIEHGFENNIINQFIDLFDSAYYELNRDNDWKTNYYAAHKEEFQNKLNALNNSHQVCSFWLNNKLVGAYIFEKNYITDITVNPVFQNQGYGNFILSHCIRNMMLNKSVEYVCLRVAKSNINAKRFYERNNFIEIACFAEHTYC